MRVAERRLVRDVARRGAATLAALTAVLSGCAGASDPTASPSSAVSGASPSTVVSATAAPSASSAQVFSPEALTHAAELERLTDLKNLQMWNGTLAPVGQLPATSQLSATSVAEVRGYAFGFS